jgi:hypothetical protein
MTMFALSPAIRRAKSYGGKIVAVILTLPFPAVEREFCGAFLFRLHPPRANKPKVIIIKNLIVLFKISSVEMCNLGFIDQAHPGLRVLFNPCNQELKRTLSATGEKR